MTGVIPTPTVPLHVIYWANEISLPHFQGTPSQPGFQILKRENIFKWLYTEYYLISLCRKDSWFLYRTFPHPHIPEQFLCQDEKEGPQTHRGSWPWGTVAAMSGHRVGKTLQNPDCQAQFPASSHRPAYLVRENNCICSPDKVVSSFPFIFFLAASYSMIASQSRSALACLVFPAKCIFL